MGNTHTTQLLEVWTRLKCGPAWRQPRHCRTTIRIPFKWDRIYRCSIAIVSASAPCRINRRSIRPLHRLLRRHRKQRRVFLLCPAALHPTHSLSLRHTGCILMNFRQSRHLPASWGSSGPGQPLWLMVSSASLTVCCLAKSEMLPKWIWITASSRFASVWQNTLSKGLTTSRDALLLSPDSKKKKKLRKKNSYNNSLVTFVQSAQSTVSSLLPSRFFLHTHIPRIYVYTHVHIHTQNPFSFHSSLVSPFFFFFHFCSVPVILFFNSQNISRDVVADW